MKKIYLAFLACATIGIIYAFTNNSKKIEKGDDPYCIEIQCKGNRWRETIYAFNASKATQIARSKYPNCKTVNFGKGKCK